MKIPKHIAIIPDGNRRWAKKRSLKPWQGHEAGAKNLEQILEAAKENNIKYISFWGSSEDNLRKRPFLEKKELLKIYQKYFKKIINSEEVHKNKIKINVLGEWKKQFPQTLKKTIEKTIEKTKNYSNFFVNFFLAYSGEKEIERAISQIAKKFKQNKIKNITGKIIKQNLLTKNLPPVDLLIRTGSLNDPHFSAGFMMWDTQNSQLFFSSKDWPDFSKKEFKKALKDFAKRTRRWGE